MANKLVQLKDGNDNVFAKSTFGWADRRHDGAITIPSAGFLDIKDLFEIPEGTFACQVRTYGTAQECFNVAYNMPNALYIFGKPNTVIGSYLTLRFYYIIN